MSSIAAKIGCTSETLRGWIRGHVPERGVATVFDEESCQATRQTGPSAFLTLLGPIVLPREFLDLGRQAWAIVGGESIGKKHPLHPDWVRGVRDQCATGGANGPVPFHFKQWGRWWPAAPVYPDEDPVWKRLHVAQQHGPDADPDEWVVDAADAVDLTLKRERLCAMDRDGAFSWHPTCAEEVQPPPAAGSWWFEDHGTRDAHRRELDGRVHDEHPWVPCMVKERVSEAA
ncbi:DUF5131 family protein (plasmid) [Azospirillum argentinense]|uniref:DUF5131 family protein n=1 Tax=Azospirillum brasilense TaxID=192 RepID=A0A4D8QAU4_AZOBR|nr:DUF5131 family protein [Azospirillum argentinense]